ncbi:MAG: nitroreductase [Oleiphilaceae bacterium]|jgi:nitroreductase
MNSEFLDLMCKRVSSPRLEAPGPSAEVLEKIFQTALRAPDHMLLRPWRYLVIEGDARTKLGDLLCEAALKDSPDLTSAQCDKYRAMPLRAPMIIVGISENHAHKKVPTEEQIVSCGVGMGYMLLALQMMDFGGVWRTGPMATNAFVKKSLGVSLDETLVGFLYIGTSTRELKPVPELNTSDYFHKWGM